MALKTIEQVPVVVAGGVAANHALRHSVRALCRVMGRECYFPDMAYCTDNAAMIAHNAYLRWRAFGVPEQTKHKVRPRWPLDEIV